MTGVSATPFIPCDTDAKSDEEVLIRYRDTGEATAFETLVHRYEKALFTYLYHYLHDAALAEDVTQATFLRLCQKCDLFDADRQFRPWLYSVATHLAIDALRSERRQHATSLDQGRAELAFDSGTLLDAIQSHTPTPIEEAETHEQAERARQAVKELPDELRVIVLLMYFQGLKLHEVAEALHLPLGTVKSRLHKALHRLSRSEKEEG